MISIIILVIFLIALTSIVSYNFLSFNHNVNISNDTEALNNELLLIKQNLIANAKPIVDGEVYSLPYGINDETLNIHKLPNGLGLPLKNIKGEFFQYCPYGVVDGTTKNDTVIQNDGSSYSVALSNLGGRDYVTHSDKEPTVDVEDLSTTAIPWVDGETSVNNGDIVIHQGDCYQAKNDPSVWETPASDSWFWDSVQCPTSDSTSVDSSSISKIQALIISKYDDSNVKCSDVEYNINNNKYYLKNAKVEYISEEDIKSYFYTSNLSSNIESYNVSNYSIHNVLETLENDLSNKSYYIELQSDVTLTKNYEFYRKPSKKISVEINTNGYEIYGDYSMSFENMSVYIHGSDGFNIPNTPVSNIKGKYSDLTIEEVSFGGVELESSELILIDSLIYSNNLQRNIYSYDSDVNIEGTINVISNDSNVGKGILDFYNSTLVVKGGSVLSVETENSKPSHILELKRSNAFISGILDHAASTATPESSISVGQESRLHLDGGTITTLGKGTGDDSAYDIDVQGILSSGGNGSELSNIVMKNQDGKNGIVKVSNGGKLALDNITIGATGSKGAYVVYESSVGNAQNGASLISGDDSVSIYSGSLGCWNGYSFSNEIGEISQNNSGTLKDNNTSNWICL